MQRRAELENWECVRECAWGLSLGSRVEGFSFWLTNKRVPPPIETLKKNKHKENRLLIER